MHSFIQDIRFSFRLMRKRPGMSLLVLAALVLGIGANSAVFSVVNAVLLRPVPLTDPDRVVFVFARSRLNPTMGISYSEYLDWKAQSRSFEYVAAWRTFNFNLTGSGVPERLRGSAVSASFLRAVGVSPALGRDFVEDDDRSGANRVAIIGHGLWQKKFGSDPAIVGKSLVFNDKPYTVIGVLPARPVISINYYDVWVPAGLSVDQKALFRENRYYFVVARLNPSTTQAQAQTEMETVAHRLSTEYPQSNKDIGVQIEGVVDMLTSRDRKPLLFMLIASGLILLLALVNVTTVFVAGAIERRKELSVRLALGAPLSLLLRQLMVQSFLFAAIGGVLGLVLARIGLTLLIAHFPWAVTRFQETTIDWSVVWFTLGVSLAVTLLSSLVPGLYTSKMNVNTELKGEWSWSPLSKFRTAGQGTLIVFEVSLAAALTLVSGLLIKSFYEVEKVDLGFDPHHLLSFQLSLPSSRYEGPAKMGAFYSQALQRIRGVPGVQAASAASVLPLTGQGHYINLQVEGHSAAAGERPFVDSASVLPGYFTTVHSPILQGRDFTDADRENTPPVAIVDNVLAARMWPGESPLGKRLRLADLGDSGPPWREVVGVIHPIKNFGPEQVFRRQQVYVPAYQLPTGDMSFVMACPNRCGSVQSAAETAIHELDKDLPLDSPRTLDDLLDIYVSSRKAGVLLLGGFATIGIVLGMIGIYGVVSNSVVRRRREIAIRLALGASVRNVVILAARMGLLGALAGILIGAAAVLSLTRVISSFLFGVTVLDPSTYLLSAIAIVVLASIASLAPARALLRLSPQDVLRE